MGSKTRARFLESNATELSTALAQFKQAKNDGDKTSIFRKKVMEKSADAYQNVIGTLQKNYRSAMSYIIEQFQNESPDSTILYFPDHKLITMYKKNAPDEEKAEIMYKLLQETKRAMDAKKSNLPISTTPVPAIPPVQVNVNPAPAQQG